MNADEERFVHRIEAFSDIVIGFTLAQVGAALVMPHHVTDLITNGLWLLIFVWAFAIVCTMWWMHNRVFRTVFYPSRASLLTNFALLATIVIQLYFAEVMAHAETLDDLVLAQHLYNTALGVAFSLVALLIYFGVHAQRATLGPDDRYRGRRGAVFVGGAAAFVFACNALTLLLGPNQWVPLILGISIPVSFTCSNLVARALGFPLKREPA